MTVDYVPGLCSMICVSYNHETYAKAALQSIFAQDYPKIEMIIVDDGSADRTVQVLEEVLRQSPYPHTLITQENTGSVGVNCNRAMAIAKGEYIGFLSFDDVLLPGVISAKVMRLGADLALAFVASTRNIEIDENDVVRDENHLSPSHGVEISGPEALLDIEFEHLGAFYAQAGIYRADVLEAVGRFDEDMTGDDIILRTKVFHYLINHPGRSFAFMSEPGFGYRKHGDNLHGKTWRQIRTIVEWKNRYFPDRPLPTLAVKWVEHFLKKCAKSGDMENLKAAVAYDAQIAAHYESYRTSWKYRRARVLGILRGWFRAS